MKLKLYKELNKKLYIDKYIFNPAFKAGMSVWGH